MKANKIKALIGVIVLGVVLSACASNQDPVKLLEKRVADVNLKDTKTELVRAIIQDLHREDNVIASKDWKHMDIKLTTEHMDSINTTDPYDGLMKAEASFCLPNGQFIQNELDLLKHDATQQEHDKKMQDIIKEYENSKKDLAVKLNKYLDGTYPERKK